MPRCLISLVQCHPLLFPRVHNPNFSPASPPISLSLLLNFSHSSSSSTTIHSPLPAVQKSCLFLSPMASTLEPEFFMIRERESNGGGETAGVFNWWNDIEGSHQWQQSIFYVLSALYALVAMVALVCFFGCYGVYFLQFCSCYRDRYMKVVHIFLCFWYSCKQI